MVGAAVKEQSFVRIHEVVAQSAVVVVQRFQRHQALVEAGLGVIHLVEENEQQAFEKVLRTLLPRSVDLTRDGNHLRGEFVDERGNLRSFHVAADADVAIERGARGERFAVVLYIRARELVVLAVAEQLRSRHARARDRVVALVADCRLLAVQLAQRIPPVGQREVFKVEYVRLIAVAFQVVGVVTKQLALGVGYEEVGLVAL